VLVVATGFNVLVDVRRGRHAVSWIRTGSHGRSWGGRLGKLLASSIARKGDAGATADAVLGRGTLDSEGARHRALATETLLWKGQQRVLVAAVLSGADVPLNG
jgi:hypothetical protein